MKKGLLLMAMLMIAASVLAPIAFAGDSGSDLGQGGEQVVGGMKGFASGGWGKALFFAALLGGVICLIFTKHRFFGLIAIIFGILIASYGTIGESLWSLFSTWGGGGQ